MIIQTPMSHLQRPPGPVHLSYNYPLPFRFGRPFVSVGGDSLLFRLYARHGTHERRSDNHAFGTFGICHLPPPPSRAGLGPVHEYRINQGIFGRRRHTRPLLSGRGTTRTWGNHSTPPSGRRHPSRYAVPTQGMPALCVWAWEKQGPAGDRVCVAFEMVADLANKVLRW